MSKHSYGKSGNAALRERKRQKKTNTPDANRNAQKCANKKCGYWRDALCPAASECGGFTCKS